ncbi:hypothetical protein [Pseudomonas sp. R76]|uniref:hypothetical protein n=1 Tax=Pseudomonas sp. R76 TaxID=1573711 RepID=UPI00131F5025|nr:hypothetical protein [Pseudomonas sp. R76]QHD05550.1 hypothetical protein PspR76_07315 [Pseudomonas sp. R76]
MKMKLAEVSVYEDTPDAGKTSIGGKVQISLEMAEGQAGGTFGVTFEHEGAKDLTYRQLEQLVIDKVRSSLTEI